jgi:hypothetical protein
VLGHLCWATYTVHQTVPTKMIKARLRFQQSGHD